ncbi:MAG: hypothetical protein AB7O26_08685 [Planctomycetaceae bacterium]
MSQLPPAPAPSGRKPEVEAQSKDQGAKKQRSVIERSIVWILILGLGGLAAFEYSQRRQYERHLEVLEAALDKSETEEDVKYADIAKNLTASPTISETNFGGAPYDLYTWRWQGLKEYKIELIVNKSDTKLIAIKSEDM